jgi:hypothetical protein
MTRPETRLRGRQVTNRPTLTVNSDPGQPGSRCVSVSVSNLHPDVVVPLGRRPDAGPLLRSIFRVSVIEADGPRAEGLPDVLGRYEVLENEVRFIPHFPFDSGIRFRAIFDPRPLGHPELSEVLTLEFWLPRPMSAVSTQVNQVFPSSDSLPENLLRFYVCFSNPMQRGRAEEQITVLAPDGRPAPDTLYRPPVELWDRSMRHLTILLDPGRLKRGVGPNRELGPPLKVGQKYKLVIGSGMIDFSGRSLGKSFYKSFQVTVAVREPIAVEQWKILPPANKGQDPLTLIFPKPLDWALLWHRITITSEDGEPIDGRIDIGRGETRWGFTPAAPWTAGLYYVRIASSLEDVCGNSLLAAFDRPLRSAGDMANQVAKCLIPFQVA